MNWDQEFQQIISSIDPKDLKDPRYDKLTNEEVSRAIVGMNETATYLGRYLLQCMLFDNAAELTEEMNVHVRELISLTDTLSAILSECRCPECTGEYDDCPTCNDEYICDDCVRRLEEDGF